MSAETVNPSAASAPPAAQPPAKPAAAPTPAPSQNSAPTAPPSNMDDNLRKLAKGMLEPNQEAQSKTTPAAAPAEKKESAQKVSVFDAIKPKEAPANPPVEHPEDKLGELPETASEVAKNGWKQLKLTAKQEREAAALAKKEAAELKAQIETLRKATPADASALDQLKSEKKALEDRLAVLDLQSHPDFLRQYSEPKKKALAEADMLLKDNGVGEAPDFVALMSKPRAEFAKTVSELASKMNTMDAASFTSAMRDAYRIQGEERNALSKSSELHQQLQSKAAAAQKQAFEDTFGKLGPSDHLLTPLPIPEGASEEDKTAAASYNEAIKGIRSNAEKFAFGRLDEKGVAAIASKAAMLDFIVQHAAPRMDREHRALIEVNKQLVEEINALRGAKKTGGFSESNQSKNGVDTSKMSFQELADHHFRGGSKGT